MTDVVTIPLSFEQEWFYLRHLLRPGESFPLTIAYDLSGHLDTHAFRLALHDMVARHQAMRLTVCRGNLNTLRQRVNDARQTIQEPIIQVVKCESRAQFQAYARAIARHDQQARWDPCSGPQHHFRLLRRSDTEHIFLSTFSHIDMDFTALSIFERDLWALYANYMAKVPVNLTERSDLTSAIRAQAGHQTRARSKNIAYWDRRIQITPPVWQYSYQPSNPHETVSASMTADFDHSIIDQLQVICRDLGCSIFHLILSVTAWLGFQMTYQDRMAVHFIVDARNMADKSIIGMFSAVRPVVFHRVAGGPGEFLNQAFGGVMQALTHHYVHGEDEIAATMRLWSRWGIEPRRALSVNYIKAPAWISERTVPPDVRVEAVDYAPTVPASPAGLGLVVFDTEDTLRVVFNYNQNKIPDAAISRLVSSFKNGLHAIAGITDDISLADLHPRVSRAVLTPLLDRDGSTSLHVNLGELRTILVQHPEVLAANVHVAQHPDGGSQVIADLRVTSEVSADELRTFCINSPAATIFTIPPTHINQIVVADPPIDARRRATPSPAYSALLRLLMDMLPKAGPESEFWAAGGSFSVITELMGRTDKMDLPRPEYRHFATPCSLTGIAERIVSADLG